jgi:acetyl esterase/lipase
MSRLWSVAQLLGWTGILAVTVWVWVHDPHLGEPSKQTSLEAVVRDQVYRADGSRLAKLDVFLPDVQLGPSGERTRHPGVLAIHGGSWIGGSRAEYGPQVSRLVEHGHVVFVADYLLSRPDQPGWPGALEDLREAVRWIRRHADEFRVDPDRLIALGSGAGGHLAALLGTSLPSLAEGETSSRVHAVVSLYGPTDLAETVRGRRLMHDPVWLFLGDRARDDISPVRAASPIHQVSGQTPPMLLVHGLEDTWVSPRQSQDMAVRLSQARVRNRLLLVPGARHGFEFRIGSPESRDLLPEILAFLETVWQVDVSLSLSPHH